LFRHSISQFEQELVTIHPGEFYATTEDTIISTVLGSCIAVGIFDPERRIGGLNHFMLPGEVGRSELIRSPNAKYGMYAMEMLINDLMKLGGRREAFKAKVFGGGSVLRLAEGAATKIPANNIDFAFEYLQKEGIPVLASDVGGREPRKIFFYARSGKVLLKRIAGTMVDLVEKEEERYFIGIKEKSPEGSITLFDQKQ
jgi:Chemotaxis protein; stimulates methylation of MCP proteins